MVDWVLLSALGLAYHPTLAFPSCRLAFKSFTPWIMADAGPAGPVTIER